MKSCQYKSSDELPLILNVQEVSNFLGLGLSQVYELVKRIDFPAFKVGSRIFVPKDKFLNPMPESVKDRCARCYEHIFLFSKSKKYFFDYKAISEPIAPATAERLKRGMKGGNKYGKPVPGQPQPQSINRPREHGAIKDADINPLRNKRDVWKINTVPFKGGHYAAYPPKLVETCLLAGCPEGGIVLDPFMGSGTTGMVASQMGRHFVGIELNPEYTELAYKRIGGEI